MGLASIEHLIDAYCAVWNEPDPVRRQRALDDIWAVNASYVDPRVHTVGSHALVAHIETVRSGRPGARIIRTSVVDTHHRLARLHGGWCKPMAPCFQKASISPSSPMT